VVIEAAGIRFVAEREQVPMVAGLRLEVEERYGRKVLIASHGTWAPGGGC
jgi:hypothetical protein